LSVAAFDNDKTMKLVRLAALIALFALFPAQAADMPVAPPPGTAVSADRLGATASYLDRRAALLLIRAAFNVIAREDLPEMLEVDAVRLSRSAPAETDEQALDLELLSEGSYFIVSLRYLIEAGGAAWPEDRTEGAYAYDALVLLESLQAQLFDTVAARADPLPLLQEVEQIHWQTEGFADVPAGASRFTGRDELVHQAMTAADMGHAT
jgi:hypothetical protein